jgi:hypothetical protein
MTRVVAFVAALMLAQACSRPRPAVMPAPTRTTFDFMAQSAVDDMLQGRFEGSATMDSGWMVVQIARSAITIPPGPAQNWRNLTVRAFLATDYTPGAWKAVAQSRPVNVFRFIDFARTREDERRTIPIDTTLRFMVPIPPGASLTTSRLAIEMEWVFVVGEYGETESRIAFSGPLLPRPVP